MFMIQLPKNRSLMSRSRQFCGGPESGKNILKTVFCLMMKHKGNG